MDGNLHVPSDVIIDASITNVIRAGGQMWNKDKRFESEKMELEPEDAFEQEDSIPQLDGGADPVSCNLCSATFEGRNKGINLLSHKINEHFKDAFRREVEDVTRIDGLYHCREENCHAKHKQKQDMFRHLATVHDYMKKFSITARSISLSHPASNAPAPGTERHG